MRPKRPAPAQPTPVPWPNAPGWAAPGPRCCLGCPRAGLQTTTRKCSTRTRRAPVAFVPVCRPPLRCESVGWMGCQGRWGQARRCHGRVCVQELSIEGPASAAGQGASPRPMRQRESARSARSGCCSLGLGRAGGPAGDDAVHPSYATPGQQAKPSGDRGRIHMDQSSFGLTGCTHIVPTDWVAVNCGERGFRSERASVGRAGWALGERSWPLLLARRPLGCEPPPSGSGSLVRPGGRACFQRKGRWFDGARLCGWVRGLFRGGLCRSCVVSRLATQQQHTTREHWHTIPRAGFFSTILSRPIDPSRPMSSKTHAANLQMSGTGARI